MGLKNSIMQAAAGIFIERPGKARNLDEWQRALGPVDCPPIYLAATGPKALALAGRLADGDKETTDDEASFRVVPRDKPVTVRLEHLYYFEGGWGSARVEGGTIETRVGDRLMMRCGRYSLQASDATQGYRQGTILALPFSAVDPYPPNPTSQAARQDPAKQTDRPNHAVNRSGR